MNVTTPIAELDGAAAWRRLTAAVTLAAIGGVGLWSSVVVLPTVEAEFGVDRGGASIPYTATMVAFAIGGAVMGRLVDRFGIMLPLIFGSVMLGVGYVVAANTDSYWGFVVVHAVLIGGLGASCTFAPLVADISHWFVKRRGIAVAIVASGNYLSGTIWPLILQPAIETIGWRYSFMGIGVLCIVTMVPSALLMSLMLGFGIVSRLASGFIADRIGGVGTLILGSTLQCLALMLYLPFDGLASLYVISALFGLSQGGIVPSYALIVRQYFPAREAGGRIGLVLMASVIGMAIGGWMSGEIYDLTGSYQAAFLNGIAWNLLNMSIAIWLLLSRRKSAQSPA
jgi:MFS family permease